MRTVYPEIGLSEARRRFSWLLRQIEKDPHAGFHIKVRDKVIAELRAPAPDPKLSGAETLLRAAREAEKLIPLKKGRRLENVSEHLNEYLYGRRGPARLRRRR